MIMSLTVNHAGSGLMSHHDAHLVIMSVVIAIFASYTALDLAGQITASKGWHRLGWLGIGAVSMGTGIWSMHFIAMLAFHLPIAVGYDIPIVIASMGVAIATSWFALFLASRPTMTRLELVGGSVVMGLGIATMHYTGMAAMQVDAVIHYDPFLVGLSGVIAIAVSAIALWLAFRLREETTVVGKIRRVVSAIIMGSAVPLMHYTGMAAAQFIPTKRLAATPFTINTSSLATTISMATLVILGLALLASLEVRDVAQTRLYLQSQKDAQTLKTQTYQLEQALSQLQQAQSKLVQTEKMSSLGQLVAGVAHEINNPINFVHGNLSYVSTYSAQLLEIVQIYRQFCPNLPPHIQAQVDDAELDFLTEDLDKVVRSMNLGTERIREIVLSLKNFSRLDESEVKEADIHAGIDSTLTILEHRFKGKPDFPEIKIVKDYGVIPKIQCYPGQLNQVFMNIISNAIDALEETEFQAYSDIVSPTITIQTTVNLYSGNLKLEATPVVMIRIVDNAKGMSETVRSRLFDPFFTTKSIGKGTGLGLSISYQVITEKHGGTLECHSAVGQGTEFMIQIPLTSKQAIAQPVSA